MITKIILFALSFLFILNSCSNAENNMILEKNFVYNFKIVPKKKNTDFGIQMNGLCGHSSYSVKSIKIKKDNAAPHVLIVLVHLVRNDPKLTGSFDEWIPIPDDITSVVFGTEKKVIWNRAGDISK